MKWPLHSLKEWKDFLAPEKALLDTLHLRKRLPTPDELELEGIHADALQEIAGKFPKTVSKKIAALLEAHR